jgi:radical SAM protein with 4Fe4S-binding SPASM domain
MAGERRKTEYDTVFTQGCLHPDYRDVMEYYEQGKVYTVQIESNLACQQGCRYCYASADDQPFRELPRKAVVAVLESAAKMGVRAIDWLGGDPLLRNDWYDLMAYAKSLHLANNIWTSGIPLADPVTAARAVEASENGFISVHLDSLNEENYGRLHTGDAKRKIAAILQGVDTVQSLGKPTAEMINCITFTKPVAGEDVIRTIRFFDGEKGMRTCLTQMCLVGLAREHHDWVPGLDAVRDACKHRDAINYPGSPFSMSSMDTTKFYCGTMICVTIDGDVTPCSVIRVGFGNVHDRSLEAIVAEHRKDLLFCRLRNRENLPGHCAECDQSAVCWGCRATAYYETGDIFASDPRCWRNREALQRE